MGGELKHRNPNLVVEFVSMRQPIDPKKQTAILTIVMLQRVNATLDDLDQLARRDKQPAPRYPSGDGFQRQVGERLLLGIPETKE
jgi:hypothetical protein